MTNRLIQILLRYPKIVAFTSFCLTILCLTLLTHLKIDSNIMALLPQNFESVQSLKAVQKAAGGTGSLTVVAEGGSRFQLIRYFEALEDALKNDPDIRYLLYKKPLKFLEANGLLWLDVDQLKMVDSHVIEWLDYYQAVKTNPKTQKPKVPKALEKLGYSLQKKAKQSAYFENKQGNMMVGYVKPAKNSVDLSYAKKVVSKVKGVSAKLEKHFPKVKVQFTGVYQLKIEHVEALGEDLTRATVFTLLGVVLLLFLFFKSFKPVLICFFPLVIGVIWTLGLNMLLVGHLNLVSAFFISILLGLGIDYSLQIYVRFQEEQTKGKDSIPALQKAYDSTGRSVFWGALTTAVVFAVLLLSDFVPFYETGVLSSLGVLCVFSSIVLHMPLLVKLLDGKASPKRTSDWGLRYYNCLLSFKKGVLFSFIFLIVAAMISMFYTRFEYDFKKLQDSSLPGAQLRHRVEKSLNFAFAASIVMAKDLEQLKQVRKFIQNYNVGKGQPIRQHHSLLNFYGGAEKEQRDKLEHVQKIKTHLQELKQNVSEKEYVKYQRFFKYLDPQFLPLSEYPQIVRDLYIGEYQREPAYFYFVRPPAPLRIGYLSPDEVFHFAKILNQIKKAVPGVQVASAAPVIQDLYHLVIEKGGEILILALLTLLAVLFLVFRSFYKMVLVLLPMASGFLLMMGCFGLSQILSTEGLTFDYLNVLFFPILLGVGIDYGVHMFDRLEEDDSQVWGTVRALSLSAATTVLGFSSLFWASYQGLRGMAWVSVLGIIFIYLVAILILPGLWGRKFLD